jgi:hypothetical protein
MQYSISTDGFEGQDLKVEYYFWSKPILLINGEPAHSGSSENEMILHRTDGKQVSASWKPLFMKWDAPQLILDGKVIIWTKPLKWYEFLWCSMSFFLGLLMVAGFITGIFGFPINIKIFRTQPNNFLKYFTTGIISVFFSILIPIFLFALLVSILDIH